MQKLTELQEWQALASHAQAIVKTNIRDFFSNDHKRFQTFSIETAGLLLDYSKNWLNNETLVLLLALAKARNLKPHIDALFRGEIVNCTEMRPALHTALRNPSNQPLLVQGEDIQQPIHLILEKMQTWVEKIRQGKWKGYSHKPITDIVNIGIGGSDLGPQMVTRALTPYCTNELRCHFISNIDGSHLFETLKELHPETTLFIVASKSFTTLETLRNADTAKEWLISASGFAQTIKSHFIAITARPEYAIAYGIDEENILPLWEWVGGRYSIWSAIGLPVAIMIGMDHFKTFLAGAHEMDLHFLQAPFSSNMPVILALLSIWYINFFHAQTHAILPYDDYLRLLPSYLQQLEMESNGKRVQKNGELVNYDTAPIIWGDMGINGQHAFYQLLYQGTRIIPIDFILPVTSHNPIGDHHAILFSNCLAQSQTLMCGKTLEEAIVELIGKGYSKAAAKQLAIHKVIPGNQPSNTILMPKLTPATLGALIALYEHKTYVQSVIWNINCFDQWGVESGKQTATILLKNLTQPEAAYDHDASTAGLLTYYHTWSQ